VSHQEGQQPVLGRPEGDRLAGGRNAMAGLVEGQALDLHALRFAHRRAAAQHRLDARNELARGERLRHVVVGAGLEARDLVGLLASCRQHHDRYVARVGVAPQGAHQLEAAHVRQHPVDQDEVRAPVTDARERFLAVLGQHDVAACPPQPEGNQVADRLFIFDDEYSRVRHAQAVRVTAHC
jgi:hypothetical protein